MTEKVHGKTAQEWFDALQEALAEVNEDYEAIFQWQKREKARWDGVKTSYGVARMDLEDAPIYEVGSLEEAQEHVKAEASLYQISEDNYGIFTQSRLPWTPLSLSGDESWKWED